MNELKRIEIDGIDLHGLTSLFTSVVRAELSERTSNDGSEEQIFTRNEAKEFLKISLSSLERYTAEGKIPGYGIGGNIRYKKSDLIAALTPIATLKS